jgi:hypothetical protein
LPRSKWLPLVAETAIGQRGSSVTAGLACGGRGPAAAIEQPAVYEHASVEQD